MKPSAEQQDFIRKDLRDNLRYRETYEELYDHILTALESQPDNISFRDAVDKIINDDFGGFNGLAVIEVRYKRETMIEMKRRYFNYLLAYFKFPLIGIVIFCSIGFYYIVKQPWANYRLFFFLALIMPLISSSLNNIRNIRLGYIFGDTKRSVKDDGFIWLKYLPRVIMIVLCLVYTLFTKDTPVLSIRNNFAVAFTMFFMLYTLQTLSFYKMYRDEFKLIISK